MTALAPTVESFFTGYLTGQRGASAAHHRLLPRHPAAPVRVCP